MFGEDLADALDDIEKIGGRRHLDADVNRALAVEAHLQFIVIRAQRDVGHVLQPHDGAAGLLEHEIAEFLGRVQVGGGGERHLHHLPLGRAQAGDIVVVGKRRAYVIGRETVGGELHGVQPGAQREVLGAQQFGRLHTLDRLQFRPHDTDEIIGDLVGFEHGAVEADIHRVDGLTDLHGQHRLLRSNR